MKLDLTKEEAQNTIALLVSGAWTEAQKRPLREAAGVLVATAELIEKMQEEVTPPAEESKAE